MCFINNKFPAGFRDFITNKLLSEKLFLLAANLIEKNSVLSLNVFKILSKVISSRLSLF